MNYIYAELNTNWLEDYNDEPMVITRREYLNLLRTINAKLDISDAANTLYAVDDLQRQVNISYTSQATNDTIVLRDSNGQVIVPQTPTSDTHSTSKYYVDASDTSTLNASKDYSDSILVDAKSYSDNILVEAKSYTDSRFIVTSVIIDEESE